MTWHARLIALVAAPTTLVAAVPPAQASEVGAVIQMTDSFIFAPDTVTVRVGEAVEWRNASRFTHTVTADPKLGGAALPAGAPPFASGDLTPGTTFRQVLTVPGTYRFFCTPHEAVGMRGMIIVTP